MASFDHDMDALLAQAEELLEDDKAEEALAIIDQAAVLDPDFPWVGLLRGAALGRLDRSDEAVPILLTVADAHPLDADLQIAAARNLCVLEHAQDGLICARRAVEQAVTNPSAHAALGECEELLGRPTEAIPAREAALALDPDDEENRFHLGLDMSEVGRYDEVLDIIAPLLAAHDDDPDLERLQGACFAYLGRHEDALLCWDKVERLEGESAYSLHNRASTLAALNRHTEALALIETAIAEDPTQVIHHYTRAMILEHIGDPTAAVDAYLEALAVAPDDIDCAINLVDVSTAHDLVDEAIGGVEALLAVESDAPSLHYARGRLLLEVDDIVNSRVELEAAIQRNPSLGVAWYALSMVCGIVGEYEESLVAADRALRSFPDDPGLWLNRGQALHELHRYPEAMASYDHVTELAPEDWSSWFHLGRLLLLDLQRAADARGILQEAVRLQPENDATRWLALCYLRLGRHTDAERELQPVLGHDPNHLWGRLVRAALHAQRGELNDAFDDLSVATGQGYDAQLLLEEPLFKPLWDSPRFRKLTARRRRMRR